MFDRSAWVKKVAIFVVSAAFVTVAVAWQPLLAEPVTERQSDAKVFAHPQVLVPGDNLTDGKSGRRFHITTETTLIWIDRMPDARYEHPTEYILISVDGVQIVKGGWWPILNGKDLFRDSQETAVKFPISLKTMATSSNEE